MPKLSENLIRDISAKRHEPDWLLQWRIDAFNAWCKMTEPHWAEIDYAPINYDDLNYYNESKPVDNSDLRETYQKMGLPENEQRALLGMATDTVIDSRSVHTSYTDELNRLDIIFLPFSCPLSFLMVFIDTADHSAGAASSSSGFQGVFLGGPLTARLRPKIPAKIAMSEATAPKNNQK